MDLKLSHMRGRTETDGILEQGADENIWAPEEGNNELEKISS
jgi:hypothetical protein